MQLLINKGVQPENRKNPVEWFCSNNVSTNKFSLDLGVKKFIDALSRTDK